MGTIVALGGGRYDNGEMLPVAEHIVSLSGKKNPEFVFIPTAGFDDMNGDEPILETYEKLGCSVKALLLTDETLTKEKIESTVLGADIIYAGGGNLQFLKDVWTRTGVYEYLKKAYDNGTVLSGYSSGAMCWFDSGYDDCGENHEFVFVHGLVGLLPFCNCPHYQSENWQTFGEAIKTQNISGVAIDNGAGLVYKDGEYYVISGTEDGDVYFYDADNGFAKSTITGNADILKMKQNK